MKAIFGEMVESVRSVEAQAVREMPPREALIAWLRVGFLAVERYGSLAPEACCPDTTPDWAEMPHEELYRFTGMLIRRAKEAGCFREELRTRSAVRDWFAASHPFRFAWARREGMPLEELYAETVEILGPAMGIPLEPNDLRLKRDSRQGKAADVYGDRRKNRALR